MARWSISRMVRSVVGASGGASGASSPSRSTRRRPSVIDQRYSGRHTFISRCRNRSTTRPSSGVSMTISAVLARTRLVRSCSSLISGSFVRTRMIPEGVRTPAGTCPHGSLFRRATRLTGRRRDRHHRRLSSDGSPMDRFWHSRVALIATVVATFAVFGLFDGLLPQTPAAERLSAMVHVVLLAFLVFGWARTDLGTRGMTLSGGRTAAIVLLGLAYVPFHL